MIKICATKPKTLSDLTVVVVVVVPVFPPVWVLVGVGEGKSSAAIAKDESVCTTTKFVDF